MIYPSFGPEASDADKTHSFNITRAVFNTEQRVTIDVGLVVAASSLNCVTQISSALAEVLSQLDEAMFDRANMVVAHYLTRAGVVIAAGHSMTPSNAGAVPPIIATLRPTALLQPAALILDLSRCGLASTMLRTTLKFSNILHWIKASNMASG